MDDDTLKALWVDVTIPMLKEKLSELGIEAGKKDRKPKLIRQVMENGMTLESFSSELPEDKDKEKKKKRKKKKRGDEISTDKQYEEAYKMAPKIREFLTKEERKLLAHDAIQFALPKFTSMAAKAPARFFGACEILKDSNPDFPLLRLLFFSDDIYRRTDLDTEDAFMAVMAFIRAPEKTWKEWDWNADPILRASYRYVKDIARSISWSLCPPSKDDDTETPVVSENSDSEANSENKGSSDNSDDEN